METFTLYSPVNHISLDIVELEKSGSGDATITDNKTRFSEVYLSGIIRLKGNSHLRFSLLPQSMYIVVCASFRRDS